jgi:hypothetical protein
MLRLFSALCASARGVNAVTLAAVFISASAFSDAPSTVAVPASAEPVVVTAKTAALSVLGADDAGEAALIYTCITGSVLWRALEIGVAPDTQIRLGESVILSASNSIAGERVITVTDASGAVFAEHRTLNPGPCSFPVLFDRAGTFTAIATLDGVSFASLVISVTQVDLQGPIACQIGFRREKEVLVYGPASAVFFTANDPTLMQVSVKETTARSVRLYLKPLKAGTPILQARLGSPTGPILAQQEVDEFTLCSQATTYIGVLETFPDGAKLLQTNLEMGPQVVNLNVSMHIIIRGVTFEDSTLDKTINTSDFTYDAASGKWLCAYRMISTPDLFTGSCHSLAIYQGSDPVGQ